MDVNKLVTVIIRSVGERTETLCFELLKQQINEENIFIVSDIPFVKTLEKTFKKAVSEGRKWTLCIDSDVLVRPGLVKDIISYAEKQNDDVFVIQGMSLDKFINCTREVGQRLFRTELLSKGFEFMSEAAEDIRPESFVVVNILNQGYKKILEPNLLIGVHDFEQSYKDIYRKCFTHTIKHQGSFDMDIIRDFWQEKSTYDGDFKVARQAFTDALEYKDKIYIDKNSKFMENFDEKLAKLQLKEKLPIDVGSNKIEEIFNLALINFLRANVFCLYSDNQFFAKL